MLVRKDFCCKKLLDEFVHRMMASGIRYELYRLSHYNFILSLQLNSTEEYTSKRQLTLTDLAPAFIFLLSGYFISILCLIGEIWSHRKNNMTFFTKRKKVKIESEKEISV